NLPFGSRAIAAAVEAAVAQGATVSTNRSAGLLAELVAQANAADAVALKDIVHLLNTWGASDPANPADLNSDGRIDSNDLMEMLTRYRN
ncbi:MAG: hypothetical protein JNK58_05435, partial [Phycisphaerae bacterium]|nr:hypothetical protein [Phycisphaerae bacterium]